HLQLEIAFRRVPFPLRQIADPWHRRARECIEDLRVLLRAVTPVSLLEPDALDLDVLALDQEAIRADLVLLVRPTARGLPAEHLLRHGAARCTDDCTLAAPERVGS